MDTHYPSQVNNILYDQLRIHSTCSCSTPHLDLTRLRLDFEHDKQDGVNIPFELLFAAGQTPCFASESQIRWKETKIWVSRYRCLADESMRKRAKERLTFCFLFAQIEEFAWKETTFICRPNFKPISQSDNAAISKRSSKGRARGILQADQGRGRQSRLFPHPEQCNEAYRPRQRNSLAKLSPQSGYSTFRMVRTDCAPL